MREGGNATIGETSANTLTVNGAVAPTAAIEPAQKTVASLPTCNSGAKGQLYAVTDANAPSWNAALSGGGSSAVLALCNGVAWVAH